MENKDIFGGYSYGLPIKKDVTASDCEERVRNMSRWSCVTVHYLIIQFSSGSLFAAYRKINFNNIVRLTFNQGYRTRTFCN